MFWAIIKDIYEEFLSSGVEDSEAMKKSCYSSMEMRRNWSQEQIKEFKFYDCSGINTLTTDKKFVSFVTEQQRTYKDGYYFVRAHFRLPKDTTLTYKIKDDRHTTAQHILAGLILNNAKIKLNYRDIPFYLNEINLDLKNKSSEHVLEKSYIEKEIGINRRADLLFELETPNLTFGKGFVFEIINTEDMKSIKEKSKDWAKVGYSLVAVPIDNFDFNDYGLKDDNYFIFYRLFDDINVYLELMRKIKENEPLIDNFNESVREMEKKMFLWRSGRHNYIFKNDEKVNEILLYCIDREDMNFKGKRKIILKCYDASNKLVDIDIWDTNPIFESIDNQDLNDNLLEVTGAYFKEYVGDISLVLNKYSKIKQINVNSKKNA